MYKNGRDEVPSYQGTVRGCRQNHPQAPWPTLYQSGQLSSSCSLLEWPHKNGTKAAASSHKSDRQGRERTAAVKCISNFSSLFRASFFHAMLAALMDSSPQACHSDPKGGISSLGRPLLTLDRTYESQEVRTSSSNPCVRDVVSDLNSLKRYDCLALKIICSTYWLQGRMVLEEMSTLSSMSVMFITKWMS
jgi:hypothetical protein